MRLYLAGPMSGLPEHNYPAFHRWAAAIRGMGHFVCNPAELNPTDVSYGQALSVDLAWIIAHAEGVVFMDGWGNSKGCAVEHALARALDLPVFFAAGAPRDVGATQLGFELRLFEETRTRAGAFQP